MISSYTFAEKIEKMMKKWKLITIGKACLITIFMLMVISAHCFPPEINSEYIKSNARNSVYFIQKQETQVSIQRNFLSVNANIISHADFKGEGILCINSPEKAVFVNLYNNSIDNMLVKQRGLVYLQGHLRILHTLSIQNHGKVILGDFNLILPDISVCDYKQRIIGTGTGKIISLNHHNIVKNSMPYHAPLTPFCNEEMPFSFYPRNLKQGFAKNERENLKTYINISTPPPKV